MNTSNTKTNDDEVLSALADGALSEVAVQQMFSRLRAAPRGVQHDAARRLERYTLLGELMRAEADSPLFAKAAQRLASRDVVGNVMQQIATETMHAQLAKPIYVTSKPAFWTDMLQGWRAPALSMALAAGVAGVMLVAVQDVGVVSQEPNFSAQVNTPEWSAQQVDLTEAAPSLSTLEASADALPDAYLLQHLAYAEGGPLRNLSSNVRLASYERP